MHFVIQCTHCQFSMSVDRQQSGQVVVCPSCGGHNDAPQFVLGEQTIVGQRYLIKYALDSNTLQQTFVASHVETGDLYHLHIFDEEFSFGIAYLDEFRYFIVGSSSAGEPTHVELIDSGVDDGTLFAVSHQSDHESLFDLVQRQGPLNIYDAAVICREVATALDKAYYDFSLNHLNLRPHCLYLTTNGDVQLTEIGIGAHLCYDESFLNSGFALWNLNYLAPELALGEGYPDWRSDIYALGTHWHSTDLSI